jgi:mandelamide amidase
MSRVHRAALPASISIATALALTACAGDTASPPDITILSASDIASGVCGGTLSSTQLTRAYLERVKAHSDHNAFVTVDEAGALAAAQRADTQRASGNCLPLQGVPIVVKDNIQAAGLPATAGTPALKTFMPVADAPVVKKLRDAGAVILGKTNMHELAFGISGFNPAYNTNPNAPGVRNAYDITRMSGGSSAGTAVAIGLRMAPAGLGTDTGGSVRIPCALNGCASLRPTIGRYPQTGIAPISHTRDTAGPMALSMRDVELMDRVITGAPAIEAAALSAVRVGIVSDFLQNLDTDTQSVFQDAVNKLKAAGVTVVNIDMPNVMAINGNVSFPVALYEAYDDMVSYLGANNTGITIDQMVSQIASPDVKGTYEGLVLPRKLPTPTGGVTDAAPIYAAAISTYRPQLQQLYATTFSSNKLDALVFPTAPRTALPANADASSLANFLLFIQNTDPGSNAGIPGIQVPVSLGPTTKLPVGVELDGPAGSDRRLIAIGLALEALFGRLPAAK